MTHPPQRCVVKQRHGRPIVPRQTRHIGPRTIEKAREAIETAAAPRPEVCESGAPPQEAPRGGAGLEEEQC